MSEEDLKLILFGALFSACSMLAFVIFRRGGRPSAKAAVFAAGAGLFTTMFLGAIYKYALSDLPIVHKLLGRKTVEEQVAKYGSLARTRIQPAFKQANSSYPPPRVTLIGLKKEAQLQVYAPDKAGVNRLIRMYPILGLSGHAGPKLANMDMQVPEGFYKIEAFQPTTPYHLALRLNYPNEFDKTRAAEDKRSSLGSDIMIHGDVGSIGCLAMGDQASEDLFILASDTGLNNITVLLLPCDLRNSKQPQVQGPKWIGKLYLDLGQALRQYPLSPPAGNH